MLTLISATKMIDHYVKGFHSVKRILLRCFCALKLLKSLDLGSRSFFIFGMILVLKAIYKFVKVFRIFYAF